MNDRNRTTGLGSLAGLMLTLLIAFSVVILLILVFSKEPGRAIYYFVVGPFTSPLYLGNLLNQATTLVFTGLGIAVAFKSSAFNLGGEGQAYAGALVTVVVLLALPHVPGLVGGSAAILASIALGAGLAGLSGFFKMRWGTSELISSFLISSAVVFIVHSLVTGPLDDPTSSMMTTARIAEQYRLMRIFRPSMLDISVFSAVAAALGTAFFLQRTHWGYEMRMCGANREFSRYAGINVGKYFVLPIAISGGFHGLAGSLAVMGTHHRLIKGATAGLGWNGIAVALIAKNNPVAVIPAALFFAYLEAGARAAMLHADVTFELAKVAQAVVFFLVTAEALYGRWGARRKAMP